MRNLALLEEIHSRATITLHWHKTSVRKDWLFCQLPSREVTSTIALKNCFSACGFLRLHRTEQPLANNVVVSFQQRTDAERFLKKFRQRLTKFGLEYHPDKTRPIEF